MVITTSSLWLVKIGLPLHGERAPAIDELLTHVGSDAADEGAHITALGRITEPARTDLTAGAIPPAALRDTLAERIP